MKPITIVLKTLLSIALLCLTIWVNQNGGNTTEYVGFKTIHTQHSLPVLIQIMLWALTLAGIVGLFFHKPEEHI